MPPAARLGDLHTCPQQTPGTPPVPHVGGPVAAGAPTVLVGAQPAACVGDLVTCVGPPDSIVKGSTSVFIGGKPAARLGDATAHGGTITAGCPTVIIGDQAGGGGGGPVASPPASSPASRAQAETLAAARASRLPLARRGCKRMAGRRGPRR